MKFIRSEPQQKQPAICVSDDWVRSEKVPTYHNDPVAFIRSIASSCHYVHDTDNDGEDVIWYRFSNGELYKVTVEYYWTERSEIDDSSYVHNNLWIEKIDVLPPDAPAWMDIDISRDWLMA